MSRFTNGAVLPKPEIVEQRAYSLPDSGTDPARLTDCGESCLSAIVAEATGFQLSPGCIRAALSLPAEDGRTTGKMLTQFLLGIGIESWNLVQTPGDAWTTCAGLRHHGRYVAILGSWLEADALHWYLAYERSTSGVYVMDPWTAQYLWLTKTVFLERFRSETVVAKLW